MANEKKMKIEVQEKKLRDLSPFLLG